MRRVHLEGRVAEGLGHEAVILVQRGNAESQPPKLSARLTNYGTIRVDLPLGQQDCSCWVDDAVKRIVFPGAEIIQAGFGNYARYQQEVPLGFAYAV